MLSDQVIRYAAALEKHGFRPVSPFHDLRTDGTHLFAVDFGQDLGPPGLSVGRERRLLLREAIRWLSTASSQSIDERRAAALYALHAADRRRGHDDDIDVENCQSSVRVSRDERGRRALDRPAGRGRAQRGAKPLRPVPEAGGFSRVDDGVKVETILELVLSALQAHAVETGAIRVLNGRYLGRYRIMEEHYGVINRASRLGEAALSPPTRKKLLAEVPGADPILGGHEFLEKFPDVSAFALNLIADTLGTKKIASGKYYSVTRGQAASASSCSTLPSPAGAPLHGAGARSSSSNAPPTPTGARCARR